MATAICVEYVRANLADYGQIVPPDRLHIYCVVMRGVNNGWFSDCLGCYGLRSGPCSACGSLWKAVTHETKLAVPILAATVFSDHCTNCVGVRYMMLASQDDISDGTLAVKRL